MLETTETVAMGGRRKGKAFSPRKVAKRPPDDGLSDELSDLDLFLLR
uniref:Uncharacterized protein n=1 Tax=Anopheles quadriannulatus TaxID=34691 RepID=A0A182XSP0_ANOQN